MAIWRPGLEIPRLDSTINASDILHVYISANADRLQSNDD